MDLHAESGALDRPGKDRDHHGASSIVGQQLCPHHSCWLLQGLQDSEVPLSKAFLSRQHFSIFHYIEELLGLMLNANIAK